MFKKLFISMSAATIAIFLVTACAEEANDASQATVAGSNIDTNQPPGQQDVTLMNQPVDFSSPEAVEKTLQNIRDKEGDNAYKKITNAMQYLMVYDLSLRNNEEKLHKKLDGMTPEEIIAKMRR
jgi:hypothetical protein